MLTVRIKPLVVTAYVLLLLPLLIFFCGWLRLYIGIPASLLLIAGFVWVLKKDYRGKHESIRLPLFHLILIVAVFGLMVALSGIAGVGVSGYDAPWRNAIFHDLISFNWPVTYDNGNALVYYCVFWLPAAVVGKLFGWAGGCFALWLYVTAIITVSYLLIMLYLKVETPGKMWLGCAFITLWSGMMFLGAALLTMMGRSYQSFAILTDGDGYLDLFFNGESFNFYYRSNAIAIRMIFNQLPYWLIVPLMLHNRTARSYLFLGLLLLPYSPWAFIGIIPIMIVLAVSSLKEAAKDEGFKGVLKSIFSPANVIALVVVLPVLACYFFASMRISGGSGSGFVVPADQAQYYIDNSLAYSTRTGSFGFLSLNRFCLGNTVALILFYLLEFGVYMFLIAPKYRKKPLFWVVLVVLMVCPLIWVGSVSGRDFCMNASLPALFILMIMTLKYVYDHVCGKTLGLRNLCLTVALTIAFLGTIYGQMGLVQKMIYNHSAIVIDDSIGTLSDKSIDKYPNFLTDAPQDTAFFKYLAR